MKQQNRTSGPYASRRGLPGGLLACALVTALMAGCASTAAPEVVCSSEWIKPRTDAALEEFTSSTRGTLEKLTKSGKRAAKKGSIGLIEKASVLLSLTSLVNSFQNSQALDDLLLLSDTCDDPNLVKNALLGTMQDYNVPQPYIDLLNELEGFMQLIENSATN